MRTALLQASEYYAEVIHTQENALLSASLSNSRARNCVLCEEEIKSKTLRSPIITAISKVNLWRFWFISFLCKPSLSNCVQLETSKPSEWRARFQNLRNDLRCLQQSIDYTILNKAVFVVLVFLRQSKNLN